MKASNNNVLKPLMQRLEKQPKLFWALVALWLTLVCGLAFVWGLGSTGLVDETEPLFAEAARQMTVTGDWVTPYFNEKTRFDKPPLVYWLMAIAYQTIGVNEWAVRFPSALAAIALTIFGFFTLKQFGFSRPVLSPEGEAVSGQARQQRWLAAWIGSGLLALTPQTIVWARTGVSDMLLSGCMGTALLAFFWGYVQPARSRAKVVWYVAFYVLAALAVLTKGPVGIVLPGLIIGAFLLYVGRLREVLREIFLLRGMLLFLAIALPWYILVYQANGEAFIESFFGYHNIERFTQVVNHHSAPWYFYFLVVLLGFIPYSIHLPVAIARLQFWQRRYWQQQPRIAHLGLFALFWLAVIFGFFTIAVTKLPSYVLPLMPAAAILTSLVWSDQMTRQANSRWVSVSSAVNLLVLVALGIALLFLPKFLGKDPAMPNFSTALGASGILLWGSGVWLAAAAAGAIALWRRRGYWLWGVQLAGFALFLMLSVMPAIHLLDNQRQLPLRQLAAIATREYTPGDEILMVGFGKPSLVFYTQHPVVFHQPTEKAIAWLKTASERPTPPQSVLLLSYPDRILQIGLPPEQYTSLGRAGSYELVRVKMPLPAQWQAVPPVG